MGRGAPRGSKSPHTGCPGRVVTAMLCHVHGTFPASCPALTFCAAYLSGYITAMGTAVAFHVLWGSLLSQGCPHLGARLLGGQWGGHQQRFGADEAFLYLPASDRTLRKRLAARRASPQLIPKTSRRNPRKRWTAGRLRGRRGKRQRGGAGGGPERGSPSPEVPRERRSPSALSARLRPPRPPPAPGSLRAAPAGHGGSAQRAGAGRAEPLRRGRELRAQPRTGPSQPGEVRPQW